MYFQCRDLSHRVLRGAADNELETQGFFFETALLMCAKVCESMIHVICQVFCLWNIKIRQHAARTHTVSSNDQWILYRMIDVVITFWLLPLIWSLSCWVGVWQLMRRLQCFASNGIQTSNITMTHLNASVNTVYHQKPITSTNPWLRGI